MNEWKDAVLILQCIDIYVEIPQIPRLLVFVLNWKNDKTWFGISLKIQFISSGSVSVETEHENKSLYLEKSKS